MERCDVGRPRVVGRQPAAATRTAGAKQGRTMRLDACAAAGGGAGHWRPVAIGVLAFSGAPRHTGAMDRSLYLVLGGSRSGKSRHAEALVAGFAAPFRYLATGQAFDDEMRDRIAVHRTRRDGRWVTVEVPVRLAAALDEAEDAPVLVDCLTLWLSNLLLGEHDVGQAVSALMDALARRRAPTVLVGSEVGMGIVPENALARRFRDEAGLLHQRVAAVADRVVLVVAGLPLVVKG